MKLDQMPDFRLYEAAIAASRTVVAVHVRDAEATRLAGEILAAAGGRTRRRAAARAELAGASAPPAEGSIRDSRR
jgi:hypothetical protein